MFFSDVSPGGTATITRASSLSESARTIDAIQAPRERRDYAGSLTPSTSSGSIAGGAANSVGACAIRACAAHHATGYLEKYSLMNVVKGLLIDRRLIGEYSGRWLAIRSHHLNGPAFGGLVGTAKGFGMFLQDQLREHSVLFSATYGGSSTRGSGPPEESRSR